MPVQKVHEGEEWAYRKARNPFQKCRIIKAPVQGGNARIQVEFEDGPSEGQREWVARRMLKAPWAKRGEFQRIEQWWSNARARAGAIPQLELDAASLILDATMQGVGDIRDGGSGILSTASLSALEELLGGRVDHECLNGALEDGGRSYLPWPALRDLAKVQAATNPRPILAYVENESTRAAELDAHQRQLDALAPSRPAIPSQQILDFEQATRESWDTARLWCGEDALGKWSDIGTLRDELERISGILGRTLDALDASGQKYQSRRLRREAGTAFLGKGWDR